MNERQLLLLSNYEYFNCSTNEGTIKENIESLKNADGSINRGLLSAQDVIGPIISEDDAIDILKQIENDPELAELTMKRNIDRGGIRATLFTSMDDSNPTLVFRGTGGTYKAWEDNVLGEYKSDTKLQRLAADFVKYECAEYSNITTTGHSKGSNLAQYVTVVCGSQIDRCVGYDGQGFGKSFREKHKAEIAVAKDKITSISAYNDFVNILLTPIAGKILYVNNQLCYNADMHSCYTILSNGKFDKNGNFKRISGAEPQIPALTMMKLAGDGLVHVLDALPNGGNEKASNVLAAWTAAALSSDQSEEYESGKITEAISDFKKYTGELFKLTNKKEELVKCSCNYMKIKVNHVKAVHGTLEDNRNKLLAYPEYVEDVLDRLDYSILGRSLTEKALKKIILKLEKNIESLNMFTDNLGQVILEYERADVLE